MDRNVDQSPKVSRRKQQHNFTLHELSSIFSSLTQTRQTHIAPQGPSSKTLARTDMRPYFVIDQGRSRNPIPPSLLSSGLGMGSLIGQGNVNPWDIQVVTSANSHFLGDSWTNYMSVTEEELHNFEAHKQEIRARKEQSLQIQQKKE